MTPTLRSVLRDEGMKEQAGYDFPSFLGFGIWVDLDRFEDGEYTHAVVDAHLNQGLREFRDPDKLRAYIKDRKHGNS